MKIKCILMKGAEGINIRERTQIQRPVSQTKTPTAFHFDRDCPFYVEEDSLKTENGRK